jgi:hypothetical protein
VSLFEEFLEMLPQEQRDFITQNPGHSGPTAFRALLDVIDKQFKERAVIDANNPYHFCCPACGAQLKAGAV